MIVITSFLNYKISGLFASYLSLKVMLGNLSDDRTFHEKTIYALHILILMLVFIILLTKERLFLSFYL